MGGSNNSTHLPRIPISPPMPVHPGDIGAELNRRGYFLQPPPPPPPPIPDGHVRPPEDHTHIPELEVPEEHIPPLHVPEDHIPHVIYPEFHVPKHEPEEEVIPEHIPEHPPVIIFPDWHVHPAPVIEEHEPVIPIEHEHIPILVESEEGRRWSDYAAYGAYLLVLMLAREKNIMIPYGGR